MPDISPERDTFREPQIHGLNTEEVRILRRLLHRMQQQVPTNLTALDSQPTQQYTPYNLPTAPVGCYVVQSPDGGIPAATYHNVSPGSLADSFTPGVAECQVFYHEPAIDLADEGVYVSIDDLIHRVYNTTETEIPAGMFVVVVRDADGNWMVFFATGTSSSGGQGIYGQPFSTPGEIMAWHDQSGWWAGTATGMRYHCHNGFGRNPILLFTVNLPNEYPTNGFLNYPYSSNTLTVVGHPGWSVQIQDLTPGVSTFVNADSVSVEYDRTIIVGEMGYNPSKAVHTFTSYWKEGVLKRVEERMEWANPGSGSVTFTEVTEHVGARTVKYYQGSAPQVWMAHYTSTGVVGVTSGSTFSQGIKVGSEAAIADLGGGASLGDVITKVNDILAKLRLAGIIST